MTGRLRQVRESDHPDIPELPGVGLVQIFGE
jgi:hypothetical protein